MWRPHSTVGILSWRRRRRNQSPLGVGGAELVEGDAELVEGEGAALTRVTNFLQNIVQFVNTRRVERTRIYGGCFKSVVSSTSTKTDCIMYTVLKNCEVCTAPLFERLVEYYSFLFCLCGAVLRLVSHRGDQVGGRIVETYFSLDRSKRDEVLAMFCS